MIKFKYLNLVVFWMWFLPALLLGDATGAKWMEKNFKGSAPVRRGECIYIEYCSAFSTKSIMPIYISPSKLSPAEWRAIRPPVRDYMVPKTDLERMVTDVKKFLSEKKRMIGDVENVVIGVTFDDGKKRKTEVVFCDDMNLFFEVLKSDCSDKYKDLYSALEGMRDFAAVNCQHAKVSKQN